MQVFKHQDMIKGWFVGGFTPTALATEAAEVGVKTYAAGASEERHYHKIAHEITMIQSGRVRMNGVEYSSGDIIVIAPGESTDFVVLEDTVTVVVKVPGALNDKYLGDPAC
jgi:quercetin dioxygenase-like cupin family protein